MQQALATTESVPGGGTIDLLSGGLQIAVPFYAAGVSDRVALELAARYDSKAQWHVQPWYLPPTFYFPYGLLTATGTPDDWHDNTSIDPPDKPCVGGSDGKPDHGWTTELGWGWRFTLGRITQYHGHSVSLPDGSMHKLYRLGEDNPTGGSSKELISRDGSRLRATWFRNVEDPYGSKDRFRNRIYKVYAPDGVIYEYGHYVSAQGDCGFSEDKVDDYERNGWYLSSMIDQFGNRIDIEYHTGAFVDHIIHFIRDTHGRVIETTLTENGNPILAGLIDSITYPTTTGTASVSFVYADEPATVWLPAGGHQTACPGEGVILPQGTAMQVALLERVHLPEGVTHSFEYNSSGEIQTHVLPTGGITTYSYGNYTFMNMMPDVVARDDCNPGVLDWYPPDEYTTPWWDWWTQRNRALKPAIQGRGVTMRTVAESTSSQVFTWLYARNQAWDDCEAPPLSEPTLLGFLTVVRPPPLSEYPFAVYTPDFHVSVRDPDNMWRTLTFLPSGIEACDLRNNVIAPVTNWLHHVYVWDRAFTSWPGLDCGAMPPSPVEAALHLENKWEVDGWSGGGDVDWHQVDQNARVSWTKVTQGSDVDMTSRCGWDGFGHFEYEVQRSNDFDFGRQVTHREYAPLVCQWILDLPVLEQVGNIGILESEGSAATVERRFTPDGQLAREIRRADFDVLADPVCDNVVDPVVKVGLGRAIEEALKDHANNWVDQVSFVGPWMFLDEGYLWCNGHWTDFNVPDPSLFGQPDEDPGPPASCNPDAEFQPPATPIEREAGAGDVQTDYFYYGSKSEPGNADAHGHPAWGQLKRTEVTGGDWIDLDGNTVLDPPTASFVKHYEWAGCATGE